MDAKSSKLKQKISANFHLHIPLLLVFWLGKDMLIGAAAVVRYASGLSLWPMKSLYFTPSFILTSSKPT